MDAVVPSRQEMFDRAVRGLHSQDWIPSIIAGYCAYLDPDTGRRCAWGWVDQSIPSDVMGTVGDLMDDGIGIAGMAGFYEVWRFAQDLQRAHDRTSAANEYKGKLWKSMRDFGQEYGLSWPEDIPSV